jgi:hypothetical protein
VTPEHRALLRALAGHARGFTREELAARLGLSDRRMRDLIEDVVATGAEPIICDRTGGAGRYRIARSDEWDAVNRECAEDLARAVSMHRKAKGRRLAFQRKYTAGDLFLASVPDELEAA